MNNISLPSRMGLLLLFALLVPLACSNDQKNSEKKDKSSETNLIEFSSKTVDGSTISTEKLNGKVVMFNYWGTWCPPCIREIPHFVETYEEYKDDGFVIVGIAVPQGDTGGKEDVLSFMEENNVTYPILMFDDAPKQELKDRYGKVRVVPTSILIDRKGNHVETFTGYTDKETLVQKVKPLLNSGDTGE